jgi:ABC-type sugar transport system ATPase subunit
MNAASSFLDLIDIGKTYPGVNALADVSLSVSPGETIGLVGENGAGKSTLMKILGGVTAPSQGTIRVDGADRSEMTVAGAILASRRPCRPTGVCWLVTCRGGPSARPSRHRRWTGR